MNNNGHDLQGAHLINPSQLVQKGKGAVQFMGFVRELDDNGMMDVGIQQTPQGSIGMAERGQYLDATELIEEITLAVRLAVRDELKAWQKG